MEMEEVVLGLIGVVMSLIIKGEMFCVISLRKMTQIIRRNGADGETYCVTLRSLLPLLM